MRCSTSLVGFYARTSRCSPPGVRAALYRALALLPGVCSSGEVTYDGKQYVTIWYTERGGQQAEFLLDPGAGRVGGEGHIERAVL